ncbi:MAG: hypothetical protein PWP23_2164 [Candidatus Sumerlaeota bacterium]|nr:hypothetical protein [Candidatus Sumerlaeota bacterium]
MSDCLPKADSEAAERPRLSLGPLVDILLPTLVWLVHTVVFVRGGGATRANDGLWQLLPREALLEQPFKSLFLLHAQPPVLNTLFALLLHIERGFGVPLQQSATLVFHGVALLSCILWFGLARRLTGHVSVAFLVLVLMVTNPAFPLFQGEFFYPHLLLLFAAVYFWAAYLWACRPTRWRLAFLLAGLGLMVQTRSLWHPVTVILPLACVAWATLDRREGWRRVARRVGAGLMVFGLLVGPWMVKNAVIFGSPGFSSWLGYNLEAKPEGAPAWAGRTRISEFIHTGQYDEALVAAYYTPERLEWLQHQAVTGPVDKLAPIQHEMLKRNMNHLAIPALNRQDVRDLVDHYRSNPDLYLQRCVSHLVKFDLPCYAQPWGRPLCEPFFPFGTPWRDVHAIVYHGRWFGHIFRAVCHCPSFFLMALLPLALFTGLAGFVLRPADPRWFTAGLMALCYLWLLAMAVFVDGFESCRMRWHLEPAYLILLAMVLVPTCKKLRNWLRPRL